MSVIGHNHEAKEEIRVEILNGIERFDGNACSGWIAKDRCSFGGISRYEHTTLILDGMALRHAVTMTRGPRAGKPALGRKISMYRKKLMPKPR
jgi:hypothetical protein